MHVYTHKLIKNSEKFFTKVNSFKRMPKQTSVKWTDAILVAMSMKILVRIIMKSFFFDLMCLIIWWQGGEVILSLCLRKTDFV